MDKSYWLPGKEDTSSDSELEELPVTNEEVLEAPATIEDVPDKVPDALECEFAPPEDAYYR